MIFNFLLDSRRWTAAALLRSKKTSLCDSDAFMQEKSKRKSAEIEIGVKVFASLLSLLNKKQGKLCFLYEESRPLVLFPGNKVEILRRESGVYFAFCSAMTKRAVSTINWNLAANRLLSICHSERSEESRPLPFCPGIKGKILRQESYSFLRSSE